MLNLVSIKNYRKKPTFVGVILQLMPLAHENGKNHAVGPETDEFETHEKGWIPRKSLLHSSFFFL